MVTNAVGETMTAVGVSLGDRGRGYDLALGFVTTTQLVLRAINDAALGWFPGSAQLIIPLNIIFYLA